MPQNTKKPPHLAKGRKREATAQFLEALAEGYSVASAARHATVARTTLYRWRLQSPTFAEHWEQAIESGTDRLEDEARRRAVEGVERPVFRGGEVVGHVRDYSDTMLMFLLKARRPEIFAGRPTASAEDKDHHGENAQTALQRKFDEITQSGTAKGLSDKSE